MARNAKFESHHVQSKILGQGQIYTSLPQETNSAKFIYLALLLVSGEKRQMPTNY